MSSVSTPRTGHAAATGAEPAANLAASEAGRLASRVKLDAALASMSDAVFISDAEGRFVEFNDAFATFHRFKNKDECKRTLAEYPDLLDVFFENGERAPLEQWAVPRALRGEAASGVEYRLRRKDTGESWVGSYGFAPIRGPGGVIVGSVVTGRDVTEQKRREEALEQANERLGLAQRAAGAGMWDWDMATGELTWSAELFHLFGLDPATTRASFEAWQAILYPDDRAEAERRFEQTLERHVPLVNQYRIVQPSGRVRWIDAVGDMTYAADGKPVRMTGICLDVTERKEAEEQLRKYREHLEELVTERTVALEAAKHDAEAASRAKGDFLASMSHEIRTPLNGILGLTELLRRAGATLEQFDLLAKLDASARHLLGVINDVLELSKIEAGKLALRDVDFDLDEALRNVRAVVGDAAAAKKLRLDFEVAGLPRALRGDPTRLAQTLVNYLGNAIKFTERGGVTLRGRVLQEDEAGYLIRFEVRDTGIGMPAEQASKLFAAFEQGEAGGKHAGTGLGLAINRRLAGLMGGEVGVESTPGRGSTFWLTARLQRGTPLATATPAESAEFALEREHQGKRVLLAEDEPTNQKVALALLRSVGLEPTLAKNGAEAVRLASEGEYDAILMDMQMPEMNGIEATQAIRRLPGRGAVPIVAMTANAFEEDREACFAAGMNDFVTKPIDWENLCETLLKWLGGVKSSVTPGAAPRPRARLALTPW